MLLGCCTSSRTNLLDFPGDLASSILCPCKCLRFNMFQLKSLRSCYIWVLRGSTTVVVFVPIQYIQSQGSTKSKAIIISKFRKPSHHFLFDFKMIFLVESSPSSVSEGCNVHNLQCFTHWNQTKPMTILTLFKSFTAIKCQWQIDAHQCFKLSPIESFMIDWPSVEGELETHTVMQTKFPISTYLILSLAKGYL